MNLKRRFKRWLYGSCPGYKGVLPYFGERLHFPPGSILFQLACEEGIFEQQNLRLMQAALRPNTHAFDVGANIGLMSAPLLATESTLRLVSIEASPVTASYLAKSVGESSRRDRWTLVPKALGATEGQIEFFASDATHGAFDGLRDTGRGVATKRVQVPLTRLDTLWIERGRPAICLVKIDVEGGEADVIRGGLECLRTTRPTIILEWNRQNLAAFQCPPETLLLLARDLNCEVLAAPQLSPVTSPENLHFQMGLTETFVLLPRS